MMELTLPPLTVAKVKVHQKSNFLLISKIHRNNKDFPRTGLSLRFQVGSALVFLVDKGIEYYEVFRFCFPFLS